jgi:hypothetical protein
MTKKILLHIGTAKTGTTSIQRWLTHVQKRGTLAPVAYPLWKDASNQQRLVTLYLGYEDLPPPMRQSYGPGGKSYTQTRERYRDHLFGELRTARDAVISAEGTSDLFSPLHAEQLRSDLESLGFQQFHVVLYVRDPADYFLSHLQQKLKMTTRTPLVPDPRSFKYEFVRMTQTWEHAFPGRLIVRRYPAEPRTDVIDDFRTVLKHCFGVAPPLIPLRVNTTISAEGMHILNNYRENFSPDSNGDLTRDAAQVVRFLAESTSGLRQTKPVLRREFAALIRANHRADGEALRARYGVDLSLQQYDPTRTIPFTPPNGVDEILDSVDSDIVQQLLLLLARQELRRSPGKRLALSVARRTYRSIPPPYRPEGMAAWLRSQLPR